MKAATGKDCLNTKSFLNRFSKIFMSGLCEEDYVIICRSLHPTIDKDLISMMVRFRVQFYSGT